MHHTSAIKGSALWEKAWISSALSCPLPGRRVLSGGSRRSIPPGLGVANSTNASEIGLASVTASAGGDASYDSIIALGAGQNKVLHANHDDVLPKPSRVSVFPANSRIISHLITHGGCVMCDRRSLSDRPRSTPLLSLRGPRQRCLGVWKKV